MTDMYNNPLLSISTLLGRCSATEISAAAPKGRTDLCCIVQTVLSHASAGKWIKWGNLCPALLTRKSANCPNPEHFLYIQYHMCSISNPTAYVGLTFVDVSVYVSFLMWKFFPLSHMRVLVFRSRKEREAKRRNGQVRLIPVQRALVFSRFSPCGWGSVKWTGRLSKHTKVLLLIAPTSISRGA